LVLFTLRQLLALFILPEPFYDKLTILTFKSCVWCREYKFKGQYPTETETKMAN